MAAGGVGAMVVQPLPSAADADAAVAAPGEARIMSMRSDHSSRFDVGAHIGTAMCRIDR